MSIRYTDSLVPPFGEWCEFANSANIQEVSLWALWYDSLAPPVWERCESVPLFGTIGGDKLGSLATTGCMFSIGILSRCKPLALDHQVFNILWSIFR